MDTAALPASEVSSDSKHPNGSSSSAVVVAARAKAVTAGGASVGACDNDGSRREAWDGWFILAAQLHSRSIYQVTGQLSGAPF